MSPSSANRGLRSLIRAYPINHKAVTVSKWSGGPYSMLCGAARDLQRCMTNLMWFEEEDILEIPLLEPADNLPIASLTLEEEATLLGKSQEAQVTATYPPGCEDSETQAWECSRAGGGSDRAPWCAKVSTTTRIQTTTTRARHPTDQGSQSWWSSKSPDTSQNHEHGHLQKWYYRQTWVPVWNSVSWASVSRVAWSQTYNHWTVSHRTIDLFNLV